MLLGFLFGFAFFCCRGGGQYLYSENQIAKKSGEGGKLLRAPFTSYSLFQNSRGRGEQSPDEISNPPPWSNRLTDVCPAGWRSRGSTSFWSCPRHRVPAFTRRRPAPRRARWDLNAVPPARCGVGYGLLDPARGPGRQVAGRSKPLPPGGKMYIYPSRDNAEYDPTLHISTSGSPR